MTPTEPMPPMDSLDSDHQPRTSRRGLVTALIAVLALVAAGVTGAALAGGGGGAGDEAALAASGGTSTATPAPGGKAFKHGLGLLRGRGHLLGMGGLHGSFVVPDGSGGYRTLVMQRGAATKVSDTSITVRSEDGFEQTYAITADTAVGADRQGVNGIAKGADVAVTGEKKGSGVTALHVADLAVFGGHGIGPDGIGPGGMRMDGPDDDAPAPTATATAEGSAFGA
jgi:hypothetical protein